MHLNLLFKAYGLKSVVQRPIPVLMSIKLVLEPQVLSLTGCFFKVNVLEIWAIASKVYGNRNWSL
jgi:hypothetical protein